MKVAGIIAEYNPFHNGHALLAYKAREAGATHVAAVMSGNFVQRGEPALMHHTVRTKAAIECGIDLVLQLPSVYAVSSAQSFAQAGVEILDGTGIVDWLVFGSECGDTEKITETAKLIYSDEIRPYISDELDKGITFAAARENALRKISPECADIIQKPNNILGVEYAAALERINSNIMPVTFKRIGAEHDSDKSNGEIASASMVREFIKGRREFGDFVPVKAEEIYWNAPVSDIKLIENAILYKMKTTTAEALSLAPDVSEGIENRIINAAKEAKNLEELYYLAKTKRYTHARIRRIIINHFLCVTAEDTAISAPYIRVAGFNEKGAELIRMLKKTAKLPVITKASDIADAGENAQKIFSLECTAGEIFSLCLPENGSYPPEKSVKPIIL